MPNDSVTWPLPGRSASYQAGGRLAPLWLWGGGRQSARGVGLRAGRVPWPRSQRPPLLTGSSSRGRSGGEKQPQQLGGHVASTAATSTKPLCSSGRRGKMLRSWSLAVGNTDFLSYVSTIKITESPDEVTVAEK